MFFDHSHHNMGLGHVAICTGNGKIVEAGDYAIKSSTIRDESYNAPYLGWAWPPSNWPGRSGGSAAADFIMKSENSIKNNIESALFKLHRD